MRLLQQKCLRPLAETDGLRPTELYARNRDVDEINARELAALDAPEMFSPSEDDV